MRDGDIVCVGVAVALLVTICEALELSVADGVRLWVLEGVSDCVGVLVSDTVVDWEEDGSCDTLCVGDGDLERVGVAVELAVAPCDPVAL